MLRLHSRLFRGGPKRKGRPSINWSRSRHRPPAQAGSGQRNPNRYQPRYRLTAARKVLAYAKANPAPKELIDAARLLIFFKGNNAHDYKFSSAVMEDYATLASPWRERYLAASVYNLKGLRGASRQWTRETKLERRCKVRLIPASGLLVNVHQMVRRSDSSKLTL